MKKHTITPQEMDSIKRNKGRARRPPNASDSSQHSGESRRQLIASASHKGHRLTMARRNAHVQHLRPDTHYARLSAQPVYIWVDAEQGVKPAERHKARQTTVTSSLSIPLPNTPHLPMMKWSSGRAPLPVSQRSDNGRGEKGGASCLLATQPQRCELHNANTMYLGVHSLTSLRSEQQTQEQQPLHGSAGSDRGSRPREDSIKKRGRGGREDGNSTGEEDLRARFDDDTFNFLSLAFTIKIRESPSSEPRATTPMLERPHVALIRSNPCNDPSLPGLEPGASGLEVQRAIPLRHRDCARSFIYGINFIAPSLPTSLLCIPAASGPV
ncbi:unnamed protein product [Pleuronectes platessa]|uniref:Uncharacterized protein n=1 Tax=Pleuronectes platessa TaxID=8262 RepID=A0A9N7YMJ9_PLEPL|nr:unnamed protein product [Pleuronectes platessa]